MLDQIIENFNLVEKEARVYLAALKMGRSRASEIAEQAQMNRITAYEILKRLSRKGLANTITYKNVTFFQVISPERFVEKMKRQLDLAGGMLPQLFLMIKSEKGRPKMDFFQGVDGIKEIYENTLLCKEKVILNIANPQNLISTISDNFFHNYVKRRVRRNIKVKVLVPDNEIGRNYFRENKETLREMKLFDEDIYPIPNEIMAYDNKVVLLSFTNKIGVVVEDEDIAKSIKSIWQILWDKI